MLRVLGDERLEQLARFIQPILEQPRFGLVDPDLQEQVRSRGPESRELLCAVPSVFGLFVSTVLGVVVTELGHDLRAEPLVENGIATHAGD